MKNKEYWDNRYSNETKLWGKEPSKSAKIIVNFLKENEFKINNILDIACGYGRDAIYFYDNGFSVKGCDISNIAIDMANLNNKRNIEFFVNDITQLSDISYPDFDLIFGNFILHLFNEEERRKILKECYKKLCTNGILALSVAARGDADFGKGQMIEENTFINERGVSKFYYSIGDIEKEFIDYKILNIILIEEKHTHGEPHTHTSYLIIAMKQ